MHTGIGAANKMSVDFFGVQNTYKTLGKKNQGSPGTCGASYLLSRNREEGRWRGSRLYPPSDHFDILRHQVLAALKIFRAAQVGRDRCTAEMESLVQHVLVVRFEYHLR